MSLVKLAMTKDKQNIGQNTLEYLKEFMNTTTKTLITKVINGRTLSRESKPPFCSIIHNSKALETTQVPHN
jgi:hypothetical protein